MKKLLFLLIIAFAIASCVSPGYTKWEHDTEAYGIKFRKLRYSIVSDSTLVGIAADTSDYAGMRISPDWVHIYKGGSLRLALLAEDFEVGKLTIPAGSWIGFRKDSLFNVVFPQDTIIEKYKVQGGGGPTGVQTGFYSGGELRSFFTDEMIRIDGLLCKGGPLNIIELYADGSLKHCHLAEDSPIQDTIYRKNSEIWLDSNGLLVK